MERVDTCIGPLLWFPVDDGGEPAALLYCDHCGAIFVYADRVDDGHCELPVLAG